MVEADATILSPGLCPEFLQIVRGKWKDKMVWEASIMEKNHFKWASFP